MHPGLDEDKETQIDLNQINERQMKTAWLKSR